ncbi:hypothetical protein [Paenibacillus sp. V4I7]|uniref:hypothetical protein n=1 Tax=Paenibacillus sp. V4I7 TaxID=3042307 RepID=UPI0027820484|nr:hypothetical protein [Paenibacillus sp. V4I7]MDQ0899445.1 hypothetical protein [Paenibacillus sp. V4I7]
MKCFGEQKESYDLKIEGDVATNPIWCNHCGYNLDLDDIPISVDLKNELIGWGTRYGKWIDWDKDILVLNGIELEEEHNKQGEKLTEEVKKELGDKYKISFSPSTSAKSYANKY